ncbi:hypothetical protein L2E82_39178 [Cichorium intybus]|uniref:Uncharacterized protein n=1 Tax=Cichorium intybus TaxID=13427 RepID=A0ACB9AHH6_CICIN|nr:hypothetical protein L2E82_39178 [Cichorium intybus]
METNVTQWATPIHPMVSISNTLLFLFLFVIYKDPYHLLSPKSQQTPNSIVQFDFSGSSPIFHLSLSSQLSLSSTNPSLDLDFADLDRCFAATAAVIGLQF